MPQHPELDRVVTNLEERLAALGDALSAHRAESVVAEAHGLQFALIEALAPMRRSALAGDLALPLRQRLALANSRVAAQRESLARACASLDRAIQVLLPAAATPHGAYSATGTTQRNPGKGLLQA